MPFDRMREYAWGNKHRQGARMMIDIIHKKLAMLTLIKWIRCVYSQELLNYEGVEDDDERLKQVKLMRALQIVGACDEEEDVQVLKAFTDWKRLDYRKYLECIQDYRDTLHKKKRRVV